MTIVTGQAIIATVGLPSSGKSSWATQQVEADTTGLLTVVNRDHIRAMTRRPYPTGEGLVTRIQMASIRAALDEGFSVIIDDTNLNPGHLEHWRQLAATRPDKCAFTVVAHFLSVPYQEVLRRNDARPEGEQVPESAILGLYDRWSPVWPEMAHARGNFTPGGPQ